MLNDEICKLRDKLNKSIEDGEDYSVIYQLSVELDDLIANFYSDRSLEDVKYICYKDMNCSGPYFYFANYCKKLAFIV